MARTRGWSASLPSAVQSSPGARALGWIPTPANTSGNRVACSTAAVLVRRVVPTASTRITPAARATPIRVSGSAASYPVRWVWVSTNGYPSMVPIGSDSAASTIVHLLGATHQHGTVAPWRAHVSSAFARAARRPPDGLPSVYPQLYHTPSRNPEHPCSGLAPHAVGESA